MILHYFKLSEYSGFRGIFIKEANPYTIWLINTKRIIRQKAINEQRNQLNKELEI